MADAIKSYPKPTPEQIERCEGMGWEFDGVDMFEKDNIVGYFDESGSWQSMTLAEFFNG